MSASQAEDAGSIHAIRLKQKDLTHVRSFFCTFNNFQIKIIVKIPFKIDKYTGIHKD